MGAEILLYPTASPNFVAHGAFSAIGGQSFKAHC
jgi:hypothetical protein